MPRANRITTPAVPASATGELQGRPLPVEGAGERSQLPVAFADLPCGAERCRLLGDYPEFLGIRHLTRLFGRSARTIRGWMQDGKLPVVWIGKQRFVPRAALEKMLRETLNTGPETGES